RVKLGELTDAALADADPVAHAGFVADLAVVTRTPDAVAAVADRLLTAGGRGRRVFLEWLSLLRVRLPEAVLSRVPSALESNDIPDDLRVRAAARALHSARSSRETLNGIVAALTAGLSPLEALARLRAVQVRMRRSKALDALIERRERRLRLSCPRCPARFGLAAMARHLFDAHGLVLDRGRARRPEKLAKRLRKRYAAGRDTTLLDEAATLSPPSDLRAWAARSRPPADDVAPLLQDAAGRGNGLCPRCLAEVPPSVEPLPPPLGLGRGRLSGDGFVVEVRGPDGLRTCSITTPFGVLRSGLDGRRAVGPRSAGVVAAGALLAAAVVLKLPAAVAAMLAGTTYFAGRLLRGPLPPANGRAVDRAWSDLVPRLKAGDPRDRFLTRLCRASVGQGDADGRAAVMTVEVKASSNPGTRAAARFLQTDDAVRLGVDRVGALGRLLSAGFDGSEGIAFAEHVAEMFHSSSPSPADAARLRVLALEGAFAAGFTPRVLADLWATCPYLHDLTGGVPLSRLGVQYVVWAFPAPRPWDAVPDTGTVFELARVAPTHAGRLLREHPDLLLYHRPQDVEDVNDWVLVCARGVVVRGKLLADADATGATRRLAHIRSEHLLPHLDAALAPVPSHPSLAALARRCGCGAEVFVSPGRVGRGARFRSV
ncbi:MAG TPA: hypothetical protein VD866_11685, partial [Urbifossiella sp.]|nr:hypothetical protein [Urbifossiella sp.]